MQVVKKANAETLKKIVDDRVSPETALVVTDGAPFCKNFIPKEKHQAGNHHREKKAGRKVSNQSAEGAFSLFKRGVVGPYHKLGVEHLDQYLGEFCWRVNRRGVEPWMFQMAFRTGTTCRS